MGIIAWIIVGLIAGFIASKIVSGSGQGFILDIVLGVVGALVGGFIMSLLGAEYAVSGINIVSIAVATGGAIVVLIIYHALFG